MCNPAYGGFACEFACPVGRAFRVNEIHPDNDHNDIGRDPIKSPRAQLDAALGACSGHGICLTTLGGDAKCKCEPGTKGAAAPQRGEGAGAAGAAQWALKARAGLARL